MNIKTKEEAKNLEKELKKNVLYSHFFYLWSFYWFEFIKKNDKKSWNWSCLVTNPNVSFDVMKSNHQYPWLTIELCLNKNITYENVVEIMENKLKLLEDGAQSLENENNFYHDIQIDLFSENENFTIELIEKNPQNIPINYTLLSLNPNVTKEYFLQHIDKNWDFWLLSQNPFVTYDIVLQFPNFSWNYQQLSSNPNITWDIVQQNPDKLWDYGLLSKNKNITWEIIQQNPDKPWSYDNFMENPNFSFDIIQQNQDIDWDIDYYQTDILENKIEFESNCMITWYDVDKYNQKKRKCKKKKSFLKNNDDVQSLEVSYSLLSNNEFIGMRVNWIYHKMEERKNHYQKLHQELIEKIWTPSLFVNDDFDC